MPKHDQETQMYFLGQIQQSIELVIPFYTQKFYWITSPNGEDGRFSPSQYGKARKLRFLMLKMCAHLNTIFAGDARTILPQ
jgi:hypothetical protein